MSNPKRKTVTQKVAEKLKGKKFVTLSSVTVERGLIPSGKGMLSVSRILRRLRQEGYIDYEDPRKHNHTYNIKIYNSKLKELFSKKQKKEKKKK